MQQQCAAAAAVSQVAAITGRPVKLRKRERNPYCYYHTTSTTAHGDKVMLIVSF